MVDHNELYKIEINIGILDKDIKNISYLHTVLEDLYDSGYIPEDEYKQCKASIDADLHELKRSKLIHMLNYKLTLNEM